MNNCRQTDSILVIQKFEKKNTAQQQKISDILKLFIDFQVKFQANLVTKLSFIFIKH